MRGLLSVVGAALIGFVFGAFALTGRAQQQQQPPALSLLPCAHAWVLYQQVAGDSVLMGVHLVNSWFAITAHQNEGICIGERDKFYQRAPIQNGKSMNYSCFPDNFNPNPR